MKSAPAPDPEGLAISALLFIAAETETLSRFLELTGLDPGEVRAAASDKRFLLAVLDFLMADEPLLLAFAASEALPPETVVAAHRKLHKAVDPAHETY
ncbi:MAG: DUF3572 family protein [Hyphomicrobiales bacterium]|jgi:hypothetical protein|nr:DUF3572 family protein [Hyphomicrobiales bacterium]